ncbi:MAG: SIMPL domain-containing protein [Actinomycetota bacterium]|nr:SIMPL domain-containing protein [Actinomycetota bacterium]
MILFATLLATACDRGTGEAPATIVVSEVGRATATPDTLTINFGVNTKAPSASQALALNEQHTGALITALRNSGATEATVDPRQLSVFPDRQPVQTQVTGYEAVNQVTAKSKDLERAGTLIDAAIAVAPEAVRVQGLIYDVEAKGAVYAAARKNALTAARDRAEQVASAAGVRLGRISAVKESEGVFPVAPFFDETAQPAEERPAPGPEGSQAARSDVAVELTVVYEVEG